MWNSEFKSHGSLRDSWAVASRPSASAGASHWQVDVASPALASGRLSLQGESVLRLVLCVVLADAAAGQLWTVIMEPSLEEDQHSRSDGRSTWRIPYAQPDALAGRLERWLSRSAGYSPAGQDSGLSRVFVAFAAPVALAAALGPLALALAGGWVVLALATRLLALSGRNRALVLSVYEIGLPWLLGWSQFGSRLWSWPVMILGAALLLLHSTLLCRELVSLRKWMVWLAAAVIVALPVVAKQPLPMIIVAVSLLAPLGLLLQLKPGSSALTWSRYRSTTEAWWWLAMGAASWAAGSISEATLLM